MTSKQRAYLRKEANGLEPVYHIGKNGLDDALIRGVGEALRARELIKVCVLESSEHTARAAALMLSKELKAEPVQVIGRRFVLYKRNADTDRYGATK